MKAGLAAGMIALSKSMKGNSKGSVILAAVADEEDTSNGTQEVLAAGWRADGAAIPEPTQLRLGVAHKGFVWVEIKIIGFAAHGSLAESGIDAIMKAGIFISALKEYNARLPIDEYLGKASLHCGLIKGGSETSTYPDICEMTVEFRTVPSQTPETIVQDLKAILQGIAEQDSQFKYKEPLVLLDRAAYKLSPEHPLMSAAIQAAEKTLERNIQPESVPGWCDAALLGQAGIPTVIFGPSGEGLHAENEFVETESIKEVEKMLSNLIRNFCI
jgi:acetylornithine deacetylase/succinyl-diaminopimelate desuccinylase-like protein